MWFRVRRWGGGLVGFKSPPLVEKTDPEEELKFVAEFCLNTYIFYVQKCLHANFVEGF